MGSSFNFKQFSLRNEIAGLKVGTDGVLLGALADIGRMSVSPEMPEGSTGRRPRILDIGTGTGVIALMLAQRCPEAELTGIDIDEHSPAEENIRNSPWPDRLRFVNKSLAGYMDGDPGLFDAIVSNPPYYDDSLLCPDADRSAARHTGSLSYREVITFANDFLSGGGTVSLILPKSEEQRCIRFAASFGLYPYRIWSIKTTPLKSPSRFVADFSRERERPERRDLTIQDSDGYTAEYKELTKEFYLNF